jgi:hypothetical protein
MAGKLQRGGQGDLKIVSHQGRSYTGECQGIGRLEGWRMGKKSGYQWALQTLWSCNFAKDGETVDKSTYTVRRLPMFNTKTWYSRPKARTMTRKESMYCSTIKLELNTFNNG